MPSIIASVLLLIVQLYFFVVLARVGFDLAASLRPDWRPKGFALVLAMTAYRLTDPPVKLLQKVVKPIRVGQAFIDPSVLLLQLILIVIMFAIPVLFR